MEEIKGKIILTKKEATSFINSLSETIKKILLSKDYKPKKENEIDKIYIDRVLQINTCEIEIKD